MILEEQVYAQAMLLAGGVDAEETELLKVLCRGAIGSLTAQLRDGLTPEDCKADFLAAAALYALAALSEAGGSSGLEYVRAGDVTLRRRSGDAAANCLRNQAELLISPYRKDSFAFLGV